MAKLKFWLIPGIVLGLVLCLAYSPGWAATTYGLLTNPSIPVKLSVGAVNVPLRFNTTADLQNFTLRVTYNPTYLTPPSATAIVESLNQAFGTELFAKANVPAEPGNELLIAACVKANGILGLKTWSAKNDTVFLTIPFTTKSSVSAATPTEVTIDGFAGKGLQELSQAKAAISFSETLCTIRANLQAKAGESLPNPLNYTLRLWGGPDNVDYRVSPSDPAGADPSSYLDFPSIKPGYSYWLGLEGCDGYKCNSKKIEIAQTQEEPVSTSLVLSRIKGRVALVRKIVNKKLQLNFAYRDYDNEIIDWPASSTNQAENVLLTLKFFKNGNTSTPVTEFTFDPKGPGTCTLGSTYFVVTPQVIVPTTSEASLFGENIKYISMTIDPNTYYLSKTVIKNTTGSPKDNRYTCSFVISASTSAAPALPYTDDAKLKMDVDIPIATVSLTQTSIGQAAASFTGNESSTAQELKIKSNFYLDDTGSAVKTIETSFSAAAMSTNYLKLAGTGEGTTKPAVYVDPNKLSTQRFNLAVELLPCESDPNITLVSINFSDEQGNTFEYDPEGARASAGALEFDVPLHKSIQKIYGPQCTDAASETLCCEEILNRRLITLKSQDDSEGNEEYIQPEAGAPKRYGIYFQRIGRAAEIFIPNGADGEGITVIYKNGLFFAHVISKHSSSWSNATSEEAADIPIVKPITTTTTSSHKDGDHWYECFIQSVYPKFLSK